MAAVAPSADQATNMMQKLSLESQTKTLEVPEPMKKPPVDSGNGMNGQIQSCERSMTPLLQDFIDPAVGYIPNYSGYYLGGYDGAANEWEDYSKYVNPEGVDLSNGVYGDNGAIMFQHCYGYAPYGPYSPAGSPVPMVHDGQLYGAQHYQYPFYQPLNATSPPYNPTPAAPVKGDISASAAADQTAPLTVETVSGNPNTILNGGSVKGVNGSAPVKQTFQNSTFNSSGSYGRAGEFTPGFQDPRFGFNGGMRSPIPWVDVSLFPDGQPRPVTSTSMVSSLSHRNNTQLSKNQNCQPLFHFMGFHQPRPMSGLNSTNGYMNRMYTSNKFYGNDGSSFKAGLPFASNGYDSRISGRGWLAVDKYKPRGRSSGFSGGFGNENVDGLNELNRGPRAKSTKNQKLFTPLALAVKGQNIPLSVTVDDEKDKSNIISDREHYNKADFPDSYANAKFYIIKSYSEDDVHKSIKYNVWASTPNGNKKLDAAYQEAQQKSEGCPVFLFFSVNTSGQFVGVAEMVGPVDFHKNFEYWQQDKWSGCFAVKWHIVKDVSNSLLKHITLENNENKPVTNSRDTQEVKLEQGLQMLKIFKEHSGKTCILDDFSFYEGRQKTIQEKKAKPQFQKQIWEGKPTDEKIKGGTNGEVRPQKPLEPPVPSVKETSTNAILTNGDAKISENRSVTKAVDASQKGGLKSTAVPEKRTVANGVVANAC